MPLGTRLVATNLSVALITTALAAQTATPTTPSEEPTRTQHAMVVTVQHNATDAGVEILKQGGNAVDAAVAVHFALAVVYPFAGNLGGGGFMLIRDKHGKAHFLDYREKAPAAATRDMYLDAQGNVVPGMSLIGYKASGVPGSVAGLAYAQKHYGKLTLAQDMAPAIRLATDGFVLTDAEARMLQTSRNVDPLPRLRPHLPARRQLLQGRRHLQATRTRRHSHPHRQRPRRRSTTAPWPTRSPTSRRPAEASSPPKTSPPTRSKSATPSAATIAATTSSPPRHHPPAASSCRDPQHPLRLRPP